jgi:Domain of unknown function (DUF4189)
MSQFKSTFRFVRVGLIASLAAFALCGVAHAGDYGATAAGINGNQVGVGYSTNYPSQDAADTKAMEECSTRTQNCQVVYRFWNGACGYITTAASNGTCYGFGSTPDIALSECQSRGCSCSTPIGGCTAP